MTNDNNNELTIEQLKNKYRSYGYDTLTNDEKIRLFLSYSEKGKNLDKATEIITKTFGNIHITSDSGVVFLMNVCKLSTSSAVLLSLIPAFSNIYTFEEYSKLQLNSSENAKEFFSALLKNNHFEKSVVIALDKKFNIINQLIFSNEEIDRVNLPFRKIYEFAQNDSIKYVIISHCHPDGNAFPSNDDINTTLKIKEMLNMADTVLVDHIIVGSDNALSMREYLKENIFDDVKNYNISTSTGE